MTENVEQEVVQEEVAPNPVEEQAKAQGWVPKEEWVAAGKDENEHRTAKEFVERGELYKSLHSNKRELAQAKAALDSLARHHQFVYEKAYQDADKKLRAEFRAAVKEGDAEAVEQIEEERADLAKEHLAKNEAFRKEQTMARSFNVNPPELDSWLSRNSWYETDIELREEADKFGRIFLRKGGDPKRLLDHVDAKMKAHMQPVKKGAPNPVGEPTRSGRKAETVDTSGLNELETKIMNDLVRAGVVATNGKPMTKEQYIKELRGDK